MFAGVVFKADYPHWKIFVPHALCFEAAFKELGIHDDQRQLLFGAHLLGSTTELMTEDTIIYNMESLGYGDWFGSGLRALMRKHEVWDYSERNVQLLAKMGIQAKHVPIGWSPAMRFADESVEHDVDVVFCGSMNERRKKVLASIESNGMSVRHVFGVYGNAFDLARRKGRINIDIKWADDVPQNIGRQAFLWANEIPVISEDDYPIHCLPDACKSALEDMERTKAKAKAKRILFERLKQTDILMEALSTLVK